MRALSSAMKKNRPAVPATHRPLIAGVVAHMFEPGSKPGAHLTFDLARGQCKMFLNIPTPEARGARATPI